MQPAQARCATTCAGENHYVPHREKMLEQDEKNSQYGTGLTPEEWKELIAHDKRKINWGLYWIELHKTTCRCGSPRRHSPEEGGKPGPDGFYGKPEWIAAAKSYQPKD
jgi:hypothetical protein